MAKVVDYNDMSVEILQATHNPAAQVAIALSITMREDAEADIFPVSKQKCIDIIRAEHTSVFEHVSYTFLIQGISRSLLAQVTRQRTAKPTSGSQHYQNYKNYPMAIDTRFEESLKPSLDKAIKAYKKAIAEGIPKEEARQVLPNASTTNYLWTIDARNLFFFLRQRLCNRNVREMRIFSQKVLMQVSMHFPELFEHAGPQCFLGKCYQKNLGMQCKERIWTLI